MIVSIKDYIAPKTFGYIAYLCAIVHFLCGLGFTTVTIALRASENEKFSCFVDAKSTVTFKKQVDKACFTRYDQAYNSPVPYYGFVLLSIGLPALVCIIYSIIIVRTRVEEIRSSYEQQTIGKVSNHELNKRTIYVFYFYFLHLVVRSLFGFIFTVLQHRYFYPNGFDFKFSCNLPPVDQEMSPKNISQNLNGTLFTCENASASEKHISGIFLSVLNTIIAFILFMEVIYLWRRLPSCDTEFVVVYFLRKRYLTAIKCVHFYKQQILDRRGCDYYINVVIHTERAPHKFCKNMSRHEIYDVYMKVPPTSILLENVRDLFYPNKDTKDKFPRTILVIGRPGIGKTVLSEQILRDWAKSKDEVDEHFYEKITFYFQLRCFNKFKNMSLKQFLQIGTGLSGETFENIYEEIKLHPRKAILVFDGLDEFSGNSISCLDQSRMIPNDPNNCMSAMNLFVKLLLGDLLRGATVLVTSRPTTDDFYSRFQFDRHVEIIGFPSSKIEEYVNQFCNSNDKSDHTVKIWNHIQSSVELLNLCYIPVNCFIVCATLSCCLSEPENDEALPTTLTELYQNALRYFEKLDGQRNTEANPTENLESLKKLQELAFRGMKSGRLIFDEELFNEQMKKSSLINCLSTNSIFSVQTQFCFIHLTIQEFLAAKHVIETLTPIGVKKFISSHAQSCNWHLVLQFIAGLLGKKIKMFDSKYSYCIRAFAECLEVNGGEIELNYKEVFIMKCLREVGDDEITENVCKSTALNDVVKVYQDLNLYKLPADTWAAVTFVCKHMRNLSILRLVITSVDCLRAVLALLRKRCINQLELYKVAGYDEVEMDNVFTELATSNCLLDHKHTKLTSLTLHDFCTIHADADLSNTCAFFENWHANHLELLDLSRNKINSRGISKLCEVINNSRTTKCKKLCLNGNRICDEGAIVLWDTLYKGFSNLTKLFVRGCSLTERCIHSLVKALQNEGCQLAFLSLGRNAIGNEGVCFLLQNALAEGNCKITNLNLDECSLTDQFIPILCKVLQREQCKLSVLSMRNNNIGDKGVAMLFEYGLTNKHCKLTDLNLRRCSLTDQCIPSVCNAKNMQDGHCKLPLLRFFGNEFTEKGRTMLYNVMKDKIQV